MNEKLNKNMIKVKELKFQNKEKNRKNKKRNGFLRLYVAKQTNFLKTRYPI